jgi:hypothetical protein
MDPDPYCLETVDVRKTSLAGPADFFYNYRQLWKRSREFRGHSGTLSGILQVVQEVKSIRLEIGRERQE